MRVLPHTLFPSHVVPASRSPRPIPPRRRALMEVVYENNGYKIEDNKAPEIKEDRKVRL